MRARQTRVQAAVTPSAACISFFSNPATGFPLGPPRGTISASSRKKNRRQAAETLYYSSPSTVYYC